MYKINSCLWDQVVTAGISLVGLLSPHAINIERTPTSLKHTSGAGMLAKVATGTHKALNTRSLSVKEGQASWVLNLFKIASD